MLAQDIISTACTLIGRLGMAQGLSPAHSTASLVQLNMLIDRLNTRRSNIYTIGSALYTLAIGTQSYTLGPTGVFAAPRPQRIVTANILLLTSPVIRTPMNLLTDQEWASKALLNVQTIPQDLFSDGSYPDTILNFYPIPDQPYQVELWTWQALPQFVALTDTLVLPPGYAEMLCYNLAVRLAPQFKLQAPPEVIAIARSSLADIQSLNMVAPRLKTEPGLNSGGATGYYNYRTGSTN